MTSVPVTPEAILRPPPPGLAAPSLARLLVLASVEAFSQAMFWRGVYFHAREAFGFTGTDNLLMALGAGIAYTCGASLSHRVTRRFDEKRLVTGVLVAQAALYGLCAAIPVAAVIVPAFLVLGFVHSMKWPVFQSYTSAGRAPRETARAIGRYSLFTSAAVWPAMVAVGPLIRAWEPAFYGLAAACSLTSLAVLAPMARRPVHLPHDHPDRPKAAEVPRLTALLWAGRWSLMSSFALMVVLSALMPTIFARLGHGVASATPLASVLDAMRFGMFVALAMWTGWRGRALPVLACALALPVGFFLVLFGPNLATVLAGEALFGAAAGVAYNSALYYAMVIRNAAVDAGGAHEGLIGAGIAIGPVAALVGGVVAPHVGGPVAGMLVGVGPVIVATTALTARSLSRLRRTR
jgi:hypothetical protein